jgi:uncharacterized beta-barrel protein YwiB (DUF1934 family)
MDRVIVKVKGQQTDAAGETSRIEMVAEGRHYYRNGWHYVLYDDQLAEDKAAAATILKIAPDTMVLLRNGSVNQEQRFAAAQESRSVYRTPYGNLDLSVTTNTIDIIYGTVSGNIDINYAMAINGKWQSQNELHIEICAAAGENSRLN